MYCTIEEIKVSVKLEFFEMAISDYLKDESSEEEKNKEIENMIAGAIEDASAEINGYLLKKYSVSQLKKSKVINKFCKDIALYNMLSRSGNDENSRENNYYLRYKNAIKFLENVAKGSIELPIDNSTNSEEQEVKNFKIGIKINSSKKVFDRNSLGGM